MATKRLSKTVLEGGRDTGNKHERWKSNSEARVKTKAYTRGLVDDQEKYEAVALPRRKVVSQGFTDKLSPAYAWLTRHCGKKWDDVYSELKEKFDTRTLAGMHVVVQHMLRAVAPHEWDYSSRGSLFVVDDRGFLRETASNYRNNYGSASRSKDKPGRVLPNDELGKWLRDRKIRPVGSEAFWMNPTGHAWSTCDNYKCWREHRIRVEWKTEYVNHRYNYRFVRGVVPADAATVPKKVETRVCYTGNGYGPQGERLSDKDRALYNSLAEFQKIAITYRSSREAESDRKAKLAKKH